MKGYLRYFFHRLLYYLTLPFRFIFRLPTEIVSAPRYILGLSLPARVAAILAVFLPILAIIAIVGYLSSERAAGWDAYAGSLLGAAILLIIVIPIVAYYAVKLWLEPVASDFPDIDEAFQAGIDALKEKNIDLRDVPLFLVLGAPESDTANSVLNAAQMKLDVAGVPKGRQPLHWYVREDAAFLVTSGLGAISRLNEIASNSVPAPARSQSTANTILPGAEDVSPTATLVSPKPGGSVTDTAVSPGPLGSPTDTAVAQSAPEPDEMPAAFASSNIRGTLQPMTGTISAGGAANEGAGDSAASYSSPLEFDRSESDEQKSRLKHLCSLLKRQRQPLCTINGALVLIPWKSIGNSIAADKLTDAVRGDLKTIQESTEMRYPITTLVTGMEAESGFLELVRRVGVDVAKQARFGKGFDVRNNSNAENLDALSSQACASFEAWVYDRFQRKDALGKQQGNGKLYSLLCRVRKDIHGRLRKILTRGIAFDGTNTTGDVEPHAFGGCYFAATGETEDKQAFVTSVFEKLVSLDEEVEWTESAFVLDERYHRLAQVGLFLSGFMLVSLVALWIYVAFN